MVSLDLSKFAVTALSVKGMHLDLFLSQTNMKLVFEGLSNSGFYSFKCDIFDNDKRAAQI